MKGLNRKITGAPIKCARCGATGTTLVKVDDHYECQDKKSCLIWSARRRHEQEKKTTKAQG